MQVRKSSSAVATHDYNKEWPRKLAEKYVVVKAFADATTIPRERIDIFRL